MRKDVKAIRQVKKLRKENKLSFRKIATLLTVQKKKAVDVQQVYRWYKYELSTGKSVDSK